MKMSQNGINHLTQFEGLRLKAYDDAQPNVNITSMAQVKGTLTIGYGHTNYVRPGMVITKAKAIDLLMTDLISRESYVRNLVKVPLTQNMCDALIDFAFNVGTGAFSKSTLLKLLNQGDYIGAADQFLVWNKPSAILIRRQAEKRLFLKDFGVAAYVHLPEMARDYNSNLQKAIKVAAALLLL